jgi:hypothetical protein
VLVLLSVVDLGGGRTVIVRSCRGLGLGLVIK